MIDTVDSSSPLPSSLESTPSLTRESLQPSIEVFVDRFFGKKIEQDITAKENNKTLECDKSEGLRQKKDFITGAIRDQVENLLRGVSTGGLSENHLQVINLIAACSYANSNFHFEQEERDAPEIVNQRLNAQKKQSELDGLFNNKLKEIADKIKEGKEDILDNLQEYLDRPCLPYLEALATYLNNNPDFSLKSLLSNIYEKEHDKDFGKYDDQERQPQVFIKTLEETGIVKNEDREKLRQQREKLQLDTKFQKIKYGSMLPRSAQSALVEFQIKEENLHGLLKYLIDHNLTGTELFTRLCGYVDYYQLSEELKQWFADRGLTQLPFRINIEPSYPIGHCHEFGHVMIEGKTWGPIVSKIEEKGSWNEVPCVNTKIMKLLDTNNDGKQDLAEINMPLWESKISYIIASRYFIGKERGRGIGVPLLNPGTKAVYFTHRDDISDHLKNKVSNIDYPVNLLLRAVPEGMDHRSDAAFYATYRHLIGEVPSLDDYQKSHSQQ